MRRVVSEVFALNLVLAALAIGSAMTPSTRVAILLFVIGGIATALLMLLAPAARRLIQLLPCEFADQAGVVGHRCVEIETPGYLGRAFGPPRVF